MAAIKQPMFALTPSAYSVRAQSITMDNTSTIASWGSPLAFQIALGSTDWTSGPIGDSISSHSTSQTQPHETPSQRKPLIVQHPIAFPTDNYIQVTKEVAEFRRLTEEYRRKHSKEYKEQTFTTQDVMDTPQAPALGRGDFRRPPTFLNVASAALFGAYCELMLVAYCPHMCHVIPVSFDENILLWIIRALGDEFINIHSRSNMWILCPNMHYSIDAGLIKFVPTMAVLDALYKYIMELWKLRRKFWANPTAAALDVYKEDVAKIQRDKIFPQRGRLYPYLVVGILCSKDFRIYRTQPHKLQEDPTFKIPNDSDFKPYGDFKVPMMMHPDAEIHAESDKEARLEKQRNALERVRFDFDAPPQVINPHTYSQPFALAQDPGYVTINVGEFAYKARLRFEASPEYKNTGKSFEFTDIIEDRPKAEAVERCEEIYLMLTTEGGRQENHAPPASAEELTATWGRAVTRRLRAEAQTAPATIANIPNAHKDNSFATPPRKPPASEPYFRIGSSDPNAVPARAKRRGIQPSRLEPARTRSRSAAAGGRRSPTPPLEVHDRKRRKVAEEAANAEAGPSNLNGGKRKHTGDHY